MLEFSPTFQISHYAAVANVPPRTVPSRHTVPILHIVFRLSLTIPITSWHLRCNKNHKYQLINSSTFWHVGLHFYLNTDEQKVGMLSPVGVRDGPELQIYNSSDSRAMWQYSLRACHFTVIANAAVDTNTRHRRWTTAVITHSRSV